MNEKNPPIYAKFLKSPTQLFKFTQRELRQRFAKSPLLLEPTPVDHILLLPTVRSERTNYRPYLPVGIVLRGWSGIASSAALCRLADSAPPLHQIALRSDKILLTFLGTSGAVEIRASSGKIYARRNPIQANQLEIFLAKPDH